MVAATIMIALALCPRPAAEQQRPAVVKPAEMDKLDWIVGKWKGTGWIQMGPSGRQTFKATETAYRRAGGHVMVFEGLGKAKVEDGGPEVVVHDAFGVAWFDRETKKYRINAYKPNGQFIEAELKAQSASFSWGFDGPYGEVRFTLKRNQAGQWFEIGEMKRGEQGWFKFFEMTLDRID